jgi:hypothetical protein
MSLVIDYIEIENFKSYYGKNILGPFHTVSTKLPTTPQIPPFKFPFKFFSKKKPRASTQ